MKVKIDNIFETICPFPIGYVYMSSNSTSPADIYGGTWSGITSGKYLRANNSWDNGGSNTITTSQMPAHSHLTSSNVIMDVGHWGTEDKGVIPQHAAGAGVNTPFGNRQIGTFNTGGGNRSIQHIKTCMLGTEQPSPQEGDKLCVNLAPYKLTLVQRLKDFVRSLLDISINQLIVQVQQTFMVVRGQLSPMVDSCSQVVRGILQAVAQRTRTGQLSDMAMRKIEYTLETIPIATTKAQELKTASIILWTEKPRHLISDYIEKIQHIMLPVCRYTAPVMLGIEPPKIFGGVI